MSITDNSAVIARLERQNRELAEALEALWQAGDEEGLLQCGHANAMNTAWELLESLKYPTNLDSEPAEQPAVPEGWIISDKQPPDYFDGDCNEDVWACHWDMVVTLVPAEDVLDSPERWIYWQPTGLKRPEPPQGGRE